MATLDELFAALQKADAAGNTDDARQLASIIRQQQGAEPTAVEKPADTRRPEDIGVLESLGAATKKGFQGMGDIASGLGLAGTSLFGSKEETAKKMADIKAEQAAQEKETPTLTAADIQRIAEERGLVKAGTQVPSYIAEQILQSAPQMALPLAVGAAASPFITPIGGAIAGVVTYGVQQFGNFLVRQAQAKDDPEELELAKAAITAGVTAPIGYYADRFTGGLGSMGAKKAMSEIYAELGKRGVAGEIGKRAAKGAGVGIIAEAPTEVLEQVAERYQAGLDLNDDQAWNEYKEAFFGAAAAGGGIGAGAKAVGAYGEYRTARDAEAALQETRSAKTAFDEAGEESGIDRRYTEQGVLIPDEQAAEGLDTGAGTAGPGDLEGNKLPSDTAGGGESTSVNTLEEKILEAQMYIRQMQAVDPNDPRIQDAITYIQRLQNPQAFNAPGAKKDESLSWSDIATPDELAALARKQSMAKLGIQIPRTARQNAPEVSGQQWPQDGDVLTPNPGLQKSDREAGVPPRLFKVAYTGTKYGKPVIYGDWVDAGTGKPLYGKVMDRKDVIAGKEPAPAESGYVSTFMETANLPKTVAGTFNAPGQQGFEFAPADETTQRAIEPEMTETPGFALAQETGAAALPKTEVEKIEEAPAVPKAKMMLIGEGANPLAPVTSLLKGLKPASLVPKQVSDFNIEVRNLIEDMAEFIGQSTKKVSRYAEEGMPSPGEGPDVSVPLDPQQRAMRLNFLDNFFNGLSNAPVEQEALTSSLSQRIAGMNADTQASLLKELTNMPAVNTVRGIRELRAKFDEAMAKFEGEQISEPVEKAAIIKPDEQASTLAKRAITILKNTPESMRTPEEKAAAIYFGRWSFSMGMRSAAFDLGSMPNKLITGPVFKNQNKSQAELFQKWVEENLSKEDAAKFNATVEDYKKQTIKAEEFEKKAEEMAKMGGAARRYGQIAGRAPTGKVSEGFKKDAGMAKNRVPSKGSSLEAARFYPMHPAIQQAIEEGNLDAALSILEKSGHKFFSGLATRLRGLGLQTAIVFDRQNTLAAQVVDAKIAEQRKDVFALVQAVSPEIYAEYFADLNNFAQIRAGLNKLTDPAIEAQVEQLKTAYDAAVAMVQSSGTYVQGLDVINLNKQQGGASNYTFLHELVHAATLYSLDPTNFDSLSPSQQKAVVELNNLYEFAKRTNLAEYGFTNVQEFVAEAFSNETFQDILKTLPYKGAQEQFRKDEPVIAAKKRKFGITELLDKQQAAFDMQEGKDSGAFEREFVESKTAEKPKTLWDKFTELVAKVFKMDNVLGYTLANANIILQAPPALTVPVAEFNARKKATILSGAVPTSPAFRKFLDKAFEGKPAWEHIKANMPRSLENLSDTFRKHVLKGFTLRQLEDLVGNKVSQLKGFINQAENMLDEQNGILNEVKNTSDKWRVYQRKNPKLSETLSKLMLDATRMGLDPNKPTGVPEMDKAWNDIGKDGQDIFNEVKQFYKTRMDAYIESVVEANKSTYRTTFDVTSPAYAAETKSLEQEPSVQKIRNYLKRHTMPVYFPIRRFGQYSLMIGRGTNKEFYLFETAAERNEASRMILAERAKQGRPIDPKDVLHRNSLQDLTSKNLQDFQFYKELQDLIDAGKGQSNADLKDDLKNKLEQLYFMLLPDQSIRKAMMNRKDIPGMSVDMLRAFESSATHIAYQHSRFKYAPTLHNLIDIARRDVSDRGLEGTVESDYVSELSNRLTNFMNPPEAGKITTNITSLSFLWYLSAPASAIVNMLGLPAIGLPVLAARYKWGATSAKMAEYTSKISTSGFKNELGETSFPSLANNLGKLSKLQQAAYRALVASGVLNITLTHDILEKANRPSDLDQGIFQKAMGVAGAPFHAAEMFTREVMGMSAFDLAYADLKKKGYTDDAAFKKAVDEAKNLTYKALGDYSTLNKPSFLQNQYVKVIFQFKQFAIHMSYLLARSAYEGIGKKYSPEEIQDIRQQIRVDHNLNKPGLPPLTDSELDAATQDYIKQVKTEARDRLAGTLGMTFVFAGVTGLPLWSTLGFIMNSLQAAFGEDDEEWDFDNWFKNWTAKTFGGFVGDSISRGVASQVIGADIGSRMSLNDLWYRDTRKSSDEVSAVQNMIIQLLGPSMGLVINTAEAVKQWNDGHLERALETASPAVVKNIMKGMRYEVEGRAVNLKGDELVSDVSGYESIIQGLGFSPERIAQRQKSNIEMKTIEQKILNRRTDLMNAFFLGVDNSDDDLIDRVLDKVEKFNAANPEVAISGDHLTRSVQTRLKNRALAESTGGISISKKLIPKLEDMQEYGNPD